MQNKDSNNDSKSQAPRGPLHPRSGASDTPVRSPTDMIVVVDNQSSSAAAASTRPSDCIGSVAQHQQEQGGPPQMLFDDPSKCQPPPQQLLLPLAMEHELRRVSSCYFSIQSQSDQHDGSTSSQDDLFVSTNDLLSLWLLDDDDDDQEKPEGCTAPAETIAGTGTGAVTPSQQPESCHTTTSNNHWLYQDDMLSHVVAFLDLPSMTAFSETARRPNAACYKQLHFKLQRAVERKSFNGSASSSSDEPTKQKDTAETAALTRLAHMDRAQADEILQTFVDRHNFKPPPCPQSLTYRLRHFMLGQGAAVPTSAEPRTMAKAALLMTLLGGAAAAAAMTSTDAAVASEALVYMEQELPQVLFKLGCVGSLMGVTAKTMHSSSANAGFTSDAGPNNVEEPALDDADHENTPVLDSSSIQYHATKSLTLGVQELRRMLMERSALFRRMQAAYDNSSTHHTEIDASVGNHLLAPLTSLSKSISGTAASSATLPFVTHETKIRVSGSVGAYVQAIRQARKQVRSIIKKERKVRYETLNSEEQEQLARTFLDACRSDETIELVKELVQSLDVDGFFLGSDGSETCALHAASFYGATNVLEFLCRGICEEDTKVARVEPDLIDASPSVDKFPEDGGLCDVNRKDKNGWTAAHFCAGSNSVPALAVLARYGAHLDVEAGNGYTPLQWALRLQNKHIAEELRRHTGNDGGNWLTNGQPLTAIANRFLAMIPAQSP